MTNYARYMLDFLKESSPEEYAMLNINEEDDELYTEESDKDGVYKLNYYFRDNLQSKYITPQLSKPRVKEGLIELTGNYMDKHAKELAAAGPVYQMTFGAGETKILYDLFGLSPEIIVDMYNEVVKETYNGKISKFITGWVDNAPHKILLTGILIDAVQNNYSDVIECITYLMAFAEYPMLYKEFWRTGVKEEVMNYTIEHLGNKFKIKKMTNLSELLKYDSAKSIESHMDRLKTGYDHVYIDFLRRFHNQFSSTFRKIANEYYKNDEENATQHNNTSVFDDGQIADSEGIAANIAQVVDRTLTKFATKEINSALVNSVAEAATVDAGNVRNFIAQIYSTKGNKLDVLVEDIITSYFKKYKSASTLVPGEFMNFGLTLFRTIASSHDPIHKEIRNILNTWMYGIIDINSMYDRPATVTNYTRAVFNYIIFAIAAYN